MKTNKRSDLSRKLKLPISKDEFDKVEARLDAAMREVMTELGYEEFQTFTVIVKPVDKHDFDKGSHMMWFSTMDLSWVADVLTDVAAEFHKRRVN